MALSPFQAFFGQYSGRLIPEDPAPQAGTHSFVFGSTVPLSFYFDPGDELLLSQTADFDDAVFLSLSGSYETQEMPLDHYWEVVLQVDGFEQTFAIPEDLENLGKRSVGSLDIGVNLEPFASGNHDINFGIRLVNSVAGTDPVEVFLPKIVIDEVRLETLPAATVVAQKIEPYVASDGDTLVLSVDGAANATATFTGDPVALTGGSEPFALTNGSFLEVRTDGTTSELVIFGDGAFNDIGAASAQEVADVINNYCERVVASDVSGDLVITTVSRGSGATLEFPSGVSASLGLAAGPHAGSGNVPFLAAITVTHAKTVIEAAVSGCTVFDYGGGRLAIRSDTGGASGSIQVDPSSTADLSTSGYTISNNSEPFNLSILGTLLISVDGGEEQVVSFLPADFSDIGAATAAEVADVINDQTDGLLATDSGGAVLLTSVSVGSTSIVEELGGSQSVIFDFQAGTAGTDATFEIDNILHDGPSGISVYNRFPVPDTAGWPQVPFNTGAVLVSFSLADLLGDTVDVNNTDITIGGSLAYSGGAFQGAFTGTQSSIATAVAEHWEIDISSLGPFDSEQILIVEVESQNSGATETLSTSWAFTFADTATPVVTSVVGIGQKTIRVTFDDDMLAESIAGVYDALNPANYSLTPLTAPGMLVEVVTVTPVSSTTFDLGLDVEHTPNAQYLLTVASGTRDSDGNGIVPPDNQFTFFGFIPSIPGGRRFNLYQMMPLFIRQEDQQNTKDLEKFLSILQENTDLLLTSIDRWADIIDIDTASENFIDAILVDLGNPFTELGLAPLELIDKRRLATVLVEIYSQKGTCTGIINAVRFFLGVELTCYELNNTDDVWSLGDDDLGIGTILGTGDRRLMYTFYLVSAILLSDDVKDKIEIICEYMKPAHTHCAGIIEPVDPLTTDHWELGISELDETTILH